MGFFQSIQPWPKSPPAGDNELSMSPTARMAEDGNQNGVLWEIPRAPLITMGEVWVGSIAQGWGAEGTLQPLSVTFPHSWNGITPGKASETSRVGHLANVPEVPTHGMEMTRTQFILLPFIQLAQILTSEFEGCRDWENWTIYDMIIFVPLAPNFDAR